MNSPSHIVSTVSEKEAVEGGEAFKTMSATRERAPVKGGGCKFSTELSVHYRLIRDEAWSHKEASVLRGGYVRATPGSAL